MMECPFCGGVIRSDDEHCGWCGRPQDVGRTKTKGILGSWLISSYVVLSMFILTLLIFNGWRGWGEIVQKIGTLLIISPMFGALMAGVGGGIPSDEEYKQSKITEYPYNG